MPGLVRSRERVAGAWNSFEHVRVRNSGSIYTRNWESHDCYVIIRLQ